MRMTNKIERREFLIRLSLLAGGAAIPGLLPCRVTAAGSNMSELSATAAVEAMRKGDMRAEDYARALLDRAQQLASLNAFRTLNREMVLEAARAADKARAAGATLGMLHGLPIPVKDSVNTKDLPTSNGTRALRDFKAKDDAAVLKPLFAQGAILMGKTNLHELSYGWTSNNATFGPAVRPGACRRRQQRGLRSHCCWANCPTGNCRGHAGVHPSSGKYVRARRIASDLRSIS